MKRRDFLKVLGITATVPALGNIDIVKPLPQVKPLEDVTVKSIPSQFLNKQIHFKGIGTFGLDDHCTLTERRGIVQYQSLAEKESIALPADRGANMDVKIYATPKEMKIFGHYFDKFEPIKEVSFTIENVNVTTTDVIIESISIEQEMDKPLALNLTLMLETENVTIKEV